MSIDNLIVSTVNQSFNKYLHSELVIGQLAHTEFRDGKNKGAEVDIVMPAQVKLFGYSGGDLPQAEEVDTSIAKILLNKGYGVHFVVNALKKKQIENAPDLKQKVALAKEYGDDSVKQAGAVIDKEYGKLYSRAGHYLASSDGSAVRLDSQVAKEILAYMKSLFTKGDIKHTSWIDGQMIAIVPPEYQYYLSLATDWMHTESGQKKVAKGFVGHLYGWDIYCSNNISQLEDGSYMPLFGQRGKTLAGGVCKDLSLMSYIPEKRFDTAYKGYGYFGVGAPRADLFGAAKVSCDLKLSIAA